MSSRDVWEACGYVESGGLFEFNQEDYNFVAWTNLKIDNEIEQEEELIHIL